MSVDTSDTLAVKTAAGPIDEARARYLALRPLEAENDSDIRALQAVYATQLKQTEWGKDLSMASVFRLTVAAIQSGLNPLFGELMILGGNIYATEPGILRVANDHPAYQGHDLEPMTEEERQAHRIPDGDYAYKCVVYRSDRKAPTVRYGRASVANISMQQMHKWAMEVAQKRATERAHSRAFSIPFTGTSEIGANDLAITSVAVTGPQAESIPGGLTPDAWAQLKEEAKPLNWSDAMLASQLRRFDNDVEKLLTHIASTLGQHRGPAVAADPNDSLSSDTRKALFATLKDEPFGITERDDRLSLASEVLNRTIKSFRELTEGDARKILDALEERAKQIKEAGENENPYIVRTASACEACGQGPGERHAVGCAVAEDLGSA